VPFASTATTSGGPGARAASTQRWWRSDQSIIESARRRRPEAQQCHRLHAPHSHSQFQPALTVPVLEDGPASPSLIRAVGADATMRRSQRNAVRRGASRGRSKRAPTRPHRLEAKDTTLSRWRHGFESRWGCELLPRVVRPRPHRAPRAWTAVLASLHFAQLLPGSLR